MFESISFRMQNKTDANNPLDIGLLLECMLFYRTTSIIANQAMLKQLIREFGLDQFVALLEERLLKIIYTESFTGIRTTTVNNGLQLYDPVIFSSPQHTFQEIIRRHCIELTGKEGKGRRVARRIEANITVVHHDTILTDGGRKSLLDQDYLRKAIPLVINHIFPHAGIDAGLEFNTERTDQGIRVHTNIDFKKLNTTPASILSHIFDAESDLYFSSTYLTELATNPLGAKLMAEKIGYLIHVASRNRDNIERFHKFVFDDARSLREAINSKVIAVADVLKVIRGASNFKEWLAKQDQSSDIVREYYKEVTKGSLLDKLPGKSARWAIFTGLGLASDAVATGGAGIVAGVALGALDTFLLDKLIKGWKPSQFIEEDVRKLMKGST